MLYDIVSCAGGKAKGGLERALASKSAAATTSHLGAAMDDVAVKPPLFAYHRAVDVDDALAHLAQLGDEAKVLAGGQSLLPMLNLRLARPSALVDVDRLGALDFIRRDGDRLTIGALCRHRSLCDPHHEALADGFEVLASAARLIGHEPIRVRGTVGGSLAHADPASEWCLVACLLDGEVVARSETGERRIPAHAFFRGFLDTALRPDELVVALELARPGRARAIVEHTERAGDFAVVAVGVALDLEGGRCRSASVALGGVSSTPIRSAPAEAVLVGAEVDHSVAREAGEAAASTLDAFSDVHGSAEYRRRLTVTLVERAVVRALEQASGPDPGGVGR